MKDVDGLRSLTRALLFAPLSACVTCSALTSPSYEPQVTTERYPPFAIYETWWSELTACAGEDGDYERIRFHVVVSPLSPTGRQYICGPGTQECVGRWVLPDDIYMAPGFVLSEPYVKHEMLHYLLQTKGHGPVFRECAGP